MGMCAKEKLVSARRAAGAVAAALFLAAAAFGQLRPFRTEMTTRPARQPKTRPAATQPTTVRVEGNFLVTADGRLRRPRVSRPKLPQKITRAFVIPIREPITSKTHDAIRRKVTRRAAGAEIIIFDMNTPGGEMGAMRKISRLIVDELENIYTVAYINPEAFSAGAIISLACNEIVMVPTAVIGDAMPIMIGPGGTLVRIPDKVRGKIESAARAEVRVLAKRNGYNEALCQAMITIDMEIWLIRHRRTGEVRVVDRAEWRGRVAGVPTTRPSGAAAPADAPWEYVLTIDGPGELVTLTAGEALRYGLAAHVLKDMGALKTHYDIVAEPVVLGDNWSEKLVEFLMHPAVLGFLFFVAILCTYVEINTPGFGVAGGVAIACAAVILGSRYLTGLASAWEIALFALGVVLLLVEIFITPGFGVLGTLGIICCVVGLLAMIVPNAPDKLPWPEGPLDWSVFTNGILALSLGFLAAIGGSIIVARYLPEVPVAGKLVLAPPRLGGVGPAGEGAAILQVRPGQVGRVVQTCRPVGKIQIGDALVDAIADGAFLSAGTDVVVLRNEGNRVVVEEKT